MMAVTVTPPPPPIADALPDDPVAGAPCAARPRLVIFCPALGRPSEVWMTRQVLAMDRFDTTVACWERAAGAPADVGTTVIPFDAQPNHGPRRWGVRARNLAGRNFYGTVGAEARHVRDLLARARPDVVLCQYGQTGLRVLPEARRAGVPVVVHFHGVDLSGSLRNPWYRWSLRRWVGAFAGIVVVAGYMKQWLVAHGVDERRVHQIPCGVPVTDAAPATDVAAQPCRFVSVGRLVEKKSPTSVIRAFARCRAAVPGVTLTVIGDGPLLAPARALAVELGVADAVDFRGAQPAEAVAAALRCAGAYVQHSVTAPGGDTEGWPVALAEAAAAGLPVVATRHAEIPNQVDDKRTGLLVDEHDWAGMGDAMTRLARDPDERARMGQAARRRAVESFDYRRQVARLQDVIAAAVAARPGRS